MKKLIQGILQFRKQVTSEQLEQYKKLALEQKPDALFIACSDSRVVPNLFASTDPGDLFVVRNVGNLIPPAKDNGVSSGDVSELAAIEFALEVLQVKDIIVCGHSECGAIHAALNKNAHAPVHLSQWIQNSLPPEDSFLDFQNKNKGKFSAVNFYSQLNVLEQIEHLKSYPLVQEKIKNSQLELHAWWFDISTAIVYDFNEKESEFIPFTNYTNSIK